MGKKTSVDVLNHDWDSLVEEFSHRYGKGSYHSGALFRRLYGVGDVDVSDDPDYRPAPDLARRVARDWELILPPLSGLIRDEGTRKFLLRWPDGRETESVVVPMGAWQTLCVSSQVGCRRGCGFCETARMGLVRDLTAAEIVAQWMIARFVLDAAVRNVVFMGMGEPFDNRDAVFRAIDILSDPRGPDIVKRRISISTSGHVDGIRRMTELENIYPERAYRTLHLAVSLNAAEDALRTELMPINRKWPLAELKRALLDAPQSRDKDALYFEYVLIPGVNDSPSDADKLLNWLDGLLGKVNLIPYNPRGASRWEKPSPETVDRFHDLIRSGGRECRTRRSHGGAIKAACGMLGNPNIPRS